MRSQTLLITAIVSVVLSLPKCAVAELITNGGFEAVTGSYAGGTMPDGWSYYSTYVMAWPEPFSTNGLWGYAPSYGGAFTGVSAADGVRWLAVFDGYNTQIKEREEIGQTLAATLIPGAQYQLSANLVESQMSAYSSGGFRVYLTNGVPDLGNLNSLQFLGEFASTTGTHNWEYRSFVFNAPANAASLPQLWFVATAADQTFPNKSLGGAFIGIDTISMNAIPEPGTITLLLAASVGLIGSERWRKWARV